MDIYAIAIWFYVAEEILYTAGIAGLQYRSVKARKPRITGFLSKCCGNATDFDKNY